MSALVTNSEKFLLLWHSIRGYSSYKISLLVANALLRVDFIPRCHHSVHVLLKQKQSGLKVIQQRASNNRVASVDLVTHRGRHARAGEGQLSRDFQQPSLVHGPLLEDQLGIMVLLLRGYLAKKVICIISAFARPTLDSEWELRLFRSLIFNIKVTQ